MKKAVLLILALLNAAVTAVFIACSPVEIVPTHWNFRGDADAFTSKWLMMIMPFLAILVGIAAAVTEYLLSKRGKGKNTRYARKIFLALFLLLTALSWLIVPLSMNNAVKIGSTVNAAMLLVLGAFIVYLGNLLPKVSQNGWIGVRTASTLSNETVWRKTHRLAGYLGVATGLLMMALGVVNAVAGIEEPFLILISAAVMLMTLAVIPAVYAAVLAKKLKNN